jgi:transposase-like protein
MEAFKNILELTQYFKDEETCRNYLAQIRWNGKPICPYCGHDKVYTIENGKRFKCANRECYSKFSVTVGTIFEDTKIPLQKWFIGIYLGCNHKKGISSLQLGRDLNITQKSAWFLLHRVREMLKDNAPDLLSNMVEVDETYVGGKAKNKHKSKRVKGTQGRSTETKTVMFGLLERDGRVIVKKVPNAKKKTLQGLIKANVKGGSTVVSDEWRGYNRLSSKYVHLRVNHSQDIFVNGIAHTQSIDGFWSLFKRGILGIYHSVSEKHIDRYCDEFAYRYNQRLFSQDSAVQTAMSQSEGRRLKYKDLTAKVS